MFENTSNAKLSLFFNNLPKMFILVILMGLVKYLESNNTKHIGTAFLQYNHESILFLVSCLNFSFSSLKKVR